MYNGGREQELLLDVKIRATRSGAKTYQYESPWLRRNFFPSFPGIEQKNEFYKFIKYVTAIWVYNYTKFSDFLKDVQSVDEQGDEQEDENRNTGTGVTSKSSYRRYTASKFLAGRDYTNIDELTRKSQEYYEYLMSALLAYVSAYHPWLLISFKRTSASTNLEVLKISFSLVRSLAQAEFVDENDSPVDLLTVFEYGWCDNYFDFLDEAPNFKSAYGNTFSFGKRYEEFSGVLRRIGGYLAYMFNVPADTALQKIASQYNALDSAYQEMVKSQERESGVLWKTLAAVVVKEGIEVALSIVMSNSPKLSEFVGNLSQLLYNVMYEVNITLRTESKARMRAVGVLASLMSRVALILYAD